ncbi:MAG: N-acyl-D-amino-acid deacylase family protein [bacterium]|jgi:N-acyl-D-amino-acid deacylase
MLDLVIENVVFADPAEKITGTGSVGIKAGRIAVLSRGSLSGRRTIDGRGLTLAPGFIDIHMHEDLLAATASGKAIPEEMAACQVRMGVTTSVGGNCGLGTGRLEEYFGQLERQGSLVNYASFVGYTALRHELGIKDEYHAASSAELEKLKEMARAGLKAGAAGISFGIEYTPGSTTEELLDVASVAKEFPNRLLAAHFRSDAGDALPSIKEMICLGRETGLPFQISHLGSCAAYGMMSEALDLISAAAAQGDGILADCYPYAAFCSFIGAAFFGGDCFERWGVDHGAIQVAEGPYAGERCDRALFEKLRREAPDTLVVAFVMREDEVLECLNHPLVLVASDALLHNGQGHPRSAGTFPRVLGRFVREGKVAFSAALRQMTLAPAERLGLKDRGRLEEGAWADLVLFDPATLVDKATFESPTSPPVGIELVLVNGEIVLQHGILTGAHPGHILRW